jgi:hypothetical protein
LAVDLEGDAGGADLAAIDPLLTVTSAAFQTVR